MYSLKGFIEFAGFANNTAGQVAKIGELSSYSQTFAREKGRYDSATNKDIVLTSFFSKEDDVVKPISSAVQTKVFDLVAWIYGQMVASNNTEDRTTFLTALVSVFGSDAEQIECGSIVTDGTHFIPEWISWKIVGQESYIRLWFSDESFQTQYDEFEIVVVPALVDLNNFFQQANTVKAYLDAMTMTLMVDRIQQAKNNYPESIIRVETYNYVAPGNPDFKVPTRWGVLIYGAAGNNVDSIKDALVNYILSHNAHSRDEWVAILPDLFKRTEFVITPLWNQYGIPNRTLEAGIHSPLVKYQQALFIAKQTATQYPAAHVDNYLTFMGHPYKSLALAVLGGPENRDGKFYLTDFYSDYIMVNTASVDFNRMSVETQEIAVMLAEMIYQAESVNKYTVLPFGMTRLIRDNILYVVKTINNIQFLVVAKINFTNDTVEDESPV